MAQQAGSRAPGSEPGIAALDHSKDSRALLREHIAKSPEDFFATANARQDGILTLEEWTAACALVLGHEEAELARELFGQMDLDKDGAVSREEFIETRNAIRLFVSGANTQGLIVEMLVGAVTAHLAKTPQPRDDDTSVADKTLDALVSLKETQLHEAVAALSKAVSAHAERVRGERDKRDTALAQLQRDKGEGKFANLPTAAFGKKDDFHKGLEVIGQPHPNTCEELIKECEKMRDSLEDFEAWNSGPNITNACKELRFIRDPFLRPEGWQDKDPSEWVPAHDYGGNRTPIRLEVFLHVLSAESSETKGAPTVRFGDYKMAHTLDKSDPRWLHEKEVDMVKVVLCRFIMSQLDAISLRNALSKAYKIKVRQSQRKADMIVQALSKGLRDGGDGSASTCTYGFLLQTVLQERAATELELEALLDHFHAKFALHPISEVEVIAGRGYTGPLFVKMNGSLRAASGKFPANMTQHLKGNTYTNLIYACNSLIRKFSQISNIPKGRVVYRGLSGVLLPECFEECEEGGGRGGVDFGFLSTTTRMEVAVAYIGDKGMPVLFKFEVGDMDRGASLSFLSQYPNEEEILIPPLSYLEVVGEPFFMETDEGVTVKVYRARINCNLKSQTIEEIVAHRQKEVLAMLPYLDGTLRRDLSRVAAALVADLEKDGAAAEKVKTKIEELEAQILSEFDARCRDLATAKKISWLNLDANYKQCIGDFIDFKHHGLTRLVKAACDHDADPQSTGLHVAAKKGHCETVAALVSAGASAGDLDQSGWTALILACLGRHEAAAAELMDATKLASALNLQGQFKLSALHLASAKGMAGTVAKLLSLGADAALTDATGKTPLDWADAEEVKAVLREQGGKHSIFYAAEGMPELVAELVKEGADAALTNVEGFTALMMACKNKHEAAAAELMEATKLAGALDLQGNQGYPGFKRSALHWASAMGLPGTVAKLLSLGADATLTDENGKTPLELAGNNSDGQRINEREVKAAFAEHTIITDDNKNMLLVDCARFGLACRLRAVLLAGANAAHTDKFGCTALWRACENEHEAVAAELLEVTKLAGALDLQDGEYQLSALHVASVMGLAGTVAKLLSLGADAALTNKSGNTALMMACKNKHEAAAAELMEATKLAGALDLQANQGSSGPKRSALHQASAMGLAVTVAKLLSLGADGTLTDENGKTPLELAGNDEVKAVFAEHAAYI